ncbi:MAG: aminotransferase class I/II-fold pyridoxal phosphate-dependent enzyme [Saprospiraceae bacterium]|nr:aminotransferase class I/II-fold pyridoxal phosphate-dependent enzyme [Saprospiraceae bacterium]
MDVKFNHIESLCASEPKLSNSTEAHQNPIFASSTFKFESIEEGMEIFQSQPGKHVYTRYGNPGIESVAQKIADLESFGTNYNAYGLLTSSGMAALYVALTSITESGNLLITQGNLYGGTTELLHKIITKHGIQVLILDLADEFALETALKTNEGLSKTILVETPSNPTLQCIHLKSICKLAKKYDTKIVVDNTFATPILQRPLNFGADVVIHSTTKYIHGHGLSTGGVVVCAEEKLHKKAWEIMKLVGCNSNPYDAWLINTGMKTLSLRINQQSNNAHFLAQKLQNHSKITKVNYPGLESHATHNIAKEQMHLFGAMLSFSVGSTLEDAKLFCNRLHHCSLAPSLGETDTMVLHPASMSHLKVPSEIRKQYGITDNLIRLSVGLEHPEDILADIEQSIAVI